MINLEKLSNYLREKNIPSITLTFEEIESILGVPLPPEAKNKEEWWWNLKESKRARAWLDVGYYTYDCKYIPVRGNVTFCKLEKNHETKESEKSQEIRELNKSQKIKGFKKIWFFLTDKDVEAHKKTMAFLEILVIPLATILTLVFTWLSWNQPEQIINNYYDSVKSDSQVEIVSIDFLRDIFYLADDSNPEGDPHSLGTFIDIKLRNKGDTVAFLKNIKFEIEDVYPLKDPREISYEAVPVSETYDFIMNSDQIQILPVSQSIPANGVDRFRIKVMSKSADDSMDVIYVFRMVFIYDGDDKIVSSARHIAVVPSFFNYVGAYVSGFDYDKWLSNYKAIKKYEKYASENEDVISSYHFQRLIEQYDEENKMSCEDLIKEYNRFNNTMIINKRGYLSEDEWKEVQERSNQSYDKIKNSDEKK